MQNSLSSSSVPAFAQVCLEQRRSAEQVKPLSPLRMSVAQPLKLANSQWFMSTNPNDDTLTSRFMDLCVFQCFRKATSIHGVSCIWRFSHVRRATHCDRSNNKLGTWQLYQRPGALRLCRRMWVELWGLIVYLERRFCCQWVISGAPRSLRAPGDWLSEEQPAPSR